MQCLIIQTKVNFCLNVLAGIFKIPVPVLTVIKRIFPPFDLKQDGPRQFPVPPWTVNKGKRGGGSESLKADSESFSYSAKLSQH